MKQSGYGIGAGGVEVRRVMGQVLGGGEARQVVGQVLGGEVKWGRL